MTRRHLMMVAGLLVVVLLGGLGYAIAGLAAPAHTGSFLDLGDPTPSPADPPPGPSTAPALHVAGNALVDDAGHPVRLLGVNRSGGEFSCVQDSGIWDGPMDNASIEAMIGWRVRAVRVPLNEDCWLGLGDVPASRSGAAYRQAVRTYAARLESFGIVPILELHWSDGRWTGPDTQCPDAAATCQKPMPDQANAPAFWAGVAIAFSDDRSVIFDLFNEPFPSNIGSMDTAAAWRCWRDGGAACAGLTYPAAGMQTLVNAVRSTGAGNVILLGGINYANTLTGWLRYRPRDPTGNLGAAWHDYDFSDCVNAGCWARQVGTLARTVPVLATEIGETDCGTGYVDRLLDWLDQHGIGYLGWTWDTWGCRDGPALISDYDGTPTVFGAAVKAHLLGN